MEKIHFPIAGKVLAVCMLFLFAMMATSNDASARARSGGRSFGGSRSFSTPRSTPNFNYRTTNPGNSSGSFMRGLGGGLLGGFLGNMLFGRTGYGMGGGGMGGGGLGLLDILLIGGIGWFIFRRVMRPRGPDAPPQNFSAAPPRNTSVWDVLSGHQASAPPPPPPMANPLSEGMAAVRRSDPKFDEEMFKEGVQDIFFKVQAAWTRRDMSAIEGLVGDQLASEYRKEFAEMRRKGTVNRMENISVRKVDIVDAGLENGFAFVTVLFTAKLLDYVVEETTGKLLEGDNTTPVKFEERWTFAAPEGSAYWKLEAIA
jgi:predicted lipid-binding transport protein (Tim44 family)